MRFSNDECKHKAKDIMMKQVIKYCAVCISIVAVILSCSKSESKEDEQKKQQAIAAVEAQITKGQQALNEMATIDEELAQYVASVKSGVISLLGTDGAIPQSVANLESKQQQFSSEYKELKTHFYSVATDIKKFAAQADATADMFIAIQTSLSGINTNILTLQSQMELMSTQTSALSQSLSTETKSITDKLTACQTEISNLQKGLQDLQGRVETLEKEYAAIISAVQSVVVVPDYNDGSVKVSDITDNKFYFEVYPLSAADSVAKLGVSAVSLDAVETEVKTKGNLDKAINMPVLAVSFDGKCLVVTADGTGLSADIKSGSKTANARLRISDGKVTRSSEYFQLAYQSTEPPIDMSVITGIAMHISCRNAEISGQVVLSGTPSSDLVFGIMYSTSKGVIAGTATSIVATKHDDDYNYIITTDVLEPETTYYYRSYLIQNTEIKYGELKSFKTLSVSSMLKTDDASDINPKDAVLHASLNLTDCKYDALEYGFEVTPDGGQTYTVKSTNLSDKKFSFKDESLSRDKQYSYVAYVKLDGHTYKGEEKLFTTTSIQASITAASSNVGYKTATISGKLTITSEGMFTKSAALYYSTTASTLETLKSNGIKIYLTLGSDGSYTADLSSLLSGIKYYYYSVAKVDDVEIATVVNNLTTVAAPAGTIELGLSVLWATCNIGASKSEEYGRYFAWGDVAGQTWNGSSWSGGGFSAYPTYELDSNNNLKPAYDAAHVLLGGTWRMPTLAEQQELIDNCTYTWTTFNGVNGILFTSKKEGYTDKSIFLPAAGDGQGGDLYVAGFYGYYWSSTSSYDIRYAMYFRFNSDYICTDYNYRYYGQSIRPVSE